MESVLKANTNRSAATTLQMEALSYERTSSWISTRLQEILRNFRWCASPLASTTRSWRAIAYIYAKSEAMLREAGLLKPGLAGSVRRLRTHVQFPSNSHAYGGTRMGIDPTQSVVDGYGVSHEVPNLVILGGSAWPTSTGYNPTKTIMAWSWRAADHLVNNWGSLAG